MGLPCVFICIAGYLLLTKVAEPVVASHADFLKETVSLQRQQDIKIDSMVAAEKQALANHTIIIDNQSKIIRVLETISLHRPTDPYKLGPSQESTIPQ